METKKSKLFYSINNSYLNGITDVIVKTLTSGPLLTVFAVSIGISNMQIGFLQSILPFSNLLHVPVAGAIENGLSPRKIAWISSLISRPFLLLVALSIFFHNKEQAILLFIFSYTLSYLLASITGGTFWPWCKLLIPQKIMASFLARRTQFIIAARISTFIITSLVIYSINRINSSLEIYCYSVFFVVAFIAGLMCTVSLYNIEDVKVKNKININICKKFKMIFFNKSFLNMLKGIGIANFILAFYTSFNIVYLLENLKYTAPIVIGFTILSDIVNIGTIKLYSTLLGKNPAKMLRFATIIFILSIIIFLVISLSFNISSVLIFTFLVIAFLLIGVGTAGYTLGINTSTVVFVPNKMSSVYISVLNICRFLFTGLGAIFGGLLLKFVNKYDYKWTIFFVVGTILFIFTYLIIKYIKPIKHNCCE